MMTEQKKSKNPKEDFDKEAFVRFVCCGLSGNGCGTEKKTISHWRKEKTWQEKCRSFFEREGD